MKRRLLFVSLAVLLASAQAVRADGFSDRGVLRSISLKVDVTNIGHYSGNFGVETDLGDWFSLSVPFNWALVFHEGKAWKAGTLYLAPELRYWPGKTYDGLYVGVHIPVQANNVYAGDEWPGTKLDTTFGPWGGGIGVGYRYHLPGQWSFLAFEAGIGAGMYGGRYFYQPRWGYETLRHAEPFRTSYGIDQLFINVVITLGKRPVHGSLPLHLYLRKEDR